MRYTIKAKEGIADFSIGPQSFTQDKIELVRCLCINETDKDDFFKAAIEDKLEVYRDDIKLPNPAYYIADVIQFSLNKEDKILLQLDWLKKQEVDQLQVPLDLQLIDLSYMSKKEAGKIYARKTSVELVYEVLIGSKTSDEAFDIEEATEKAQNKLKDGHFKSALKYIERSELNGAYTQTVKDKYISEINTFISQLY